MLTFQRRIILLLILIINVSVCFAVDGTTAVNNFLKRSGVKPTSVSIKVVDLASGDVLAAHNTEKSLIPASIMKSVTTASLLQSVGPDWKYQTHIYIDGPSDFGYLRGNLIIAGACDPTINSEKEPYSLDIIDEICNALEYNRINRIEGDIIIDEEAFSGSSRPASWAAGDHKKYYGTGSHAFNYEDNVNGDFAVEHPKRVFMSHLKNALQNRGIELEEKHVTPGKRIHLLAHQSAPVEEIMRSCMVRSDNMFAESMLRTYGKIEGTDGSTDQAAIKELQFWKKKKLPLTGVKIVDGSGLSRQNRVTADFMAALLQTMSSDPYYASFFPLAGQEGTLKKFLAETELDSYIAMKTGSMNGIQCYAGYKLDDDYVPTHVVVIILNDLPANKKRVVDAAQSFLLNLFQISDQ